MSHEVEADYWDWWIPGAHEVNDPNNREYQAYIKRAKPYNSRYRILMALLAHDAMPIWDFEGLSEMATCLTTLDTLGIRLHCSRSTVQRTIRELVKWGDLEMEPCDGYCRYGGRKKHGGTNHYFLKLPVGAKPWQDRRRTRSRHQ